MLDTKLIHSANLGAHLDHKLMFDFFATFSRFEFALKQEAEFRSNEGGPDWDKYARLIDVPFRTAYENDEALRHAVDALVDAPPQKQTVDLAWKDVAAQGEPTSTLNMVCVVRRIRNNLFHGGKAQRNKANAERDNELVQNALIVLDRALECDDRVKDHFIK